MKADTKNLVAHALLDVTGGNPSLSARDHKDHQAAPGGGHYAPAAGASMALCAARLRVRQGSGVTGEYGRGEPPRTPRKTRDEYLAEQVMSVPITAIAELAAGQRPSGQPFQPELLAASRPSRRTPDGSDRKSTRLNSSHVKI